MRVAGVAVAGLREVEGAAGGAADRAAVAEPLVAVGQRVAVGVGEAAGRGRDDVVARRSRRLDLHRPGAGAELATVALALAASLVAPLCVPRGHVDADRVAAVAVAGLGEVERRRRRAADGRAVAEPAVLVGDADSPSGSRKPLGVAVTVSAVFGAAGDSATVPSTGVELVPLMVLPPRATGLVPPAGSTAETSTAMRSPRSPLPGSERSSVRDGRAGDRRPVAEPLVAVGERVAVDVGEAGGVGLARRRWSTGTSGGRSRCRPSAPCWRPSPSARPGRSRRRGRRWRRPRRARCRRGRRCRPRRG